VTHPEAHKQASDRFMEYMRENMIQCGQCKMSVHFRCDRMFEDQETLRRFKALQQGIISDQTFQEVKYHCPYCRQHSR
jgi:hypothetical protein